MRLFKLRRLSGDAAGSDSSRTQLIYGFETTYGTPPTPGLNVFKAVRFNRSSINHRNRTGVSAEIRSDRMRSDLMLLATGVDGGFESEFHTSTVATNIGGFDELMEAAMMGTWTTNVLKNGTTNRSISIEQGYTDIGRYILYKGCVINAMNLNMAAEAYITLGFDVMGTQGLVSATSVEPTPGNIQQQNSNSPLTSGQFITGLTSTPAILTNTCVRSLRLALNNNIRERMCVDSYITRDPGRGSSDVTGSMEMYFQDSLAYTQFLNNSFLDFSFTIGDVGTGTRIYTFRMPKLKFSAGSADIGGIDQDITQSFDFRALYDSGTSCELMITRATNP